MYGVSLYPLCMVTEYVPNGDLFRFLQKGDISWRFKLKLAHDIAKGMQYLHSISPPLIHRYSINPPYPLPHLPKQYYGIEALTNNRDLKSPNVLMESCDPNARVNCKVADFGLTRYGRKINTDNNLIFYFQNSYN